MNVRWGTVRVLFQHEIRTLVRDRRAVFLSIVLPLTALFLLIAARTTRGGWRWRWGEKE